MALNEKELARLERQYMLGLIDDNYYYANNGRGLTENYTEYRMKKGLENRKRLQKEIEERELMERINKQIDKQVSKQINDRLQNSIEKAIEKALINIEKGLIK